MSKDPEIIFSGRVINLKFIPEKPAWWNTNIESLEGKDVEVTIGEKKRKKSLPQLAFYFGGIIRTACMRSSVFAGWEFRAIDDHLRDLFASYPMTMVTKDGKISVTIVRDDIATYKIDQMNFFIERVLQYLLDEHDIEVPDPLDFKLNKYLKTE